MTIENVQILGVSPFFRSNRTTVKQQLNDDKQKILSKFICLRPGCVAFKTVILLFGKKGKSPGVPLKFTRFVLSY